MRRLRLRSSRASGKSSVIRHVDYGYGGAKAPGAPSPGRMVRVMPGMPWANRGVRRPMHPLNYNNFSLTRRSKDYY